ncbi:hypothetical protein [Burkholderia gladioli]|uniref:hypothetical protein n=1 Tax=Burkholderia gladioli TaxID=28095 RepID=UPI00163F570F|nr:hypothetical protein [Burkholderia gladioli]
MDGEETMPYSVLRGALAGWRRIEPVEIEEAFLGFRKIILPYGGCQINLIEI